MFEFFDPVALPVAFITYFMSELHIQGLSKIIFLSNLSKRNILE